MTKKKKENLNKGIIPIFEPGLETLMTKNVSKSRLEFSNSLAESTKGANFAFIAVGRPPREDGSADLKYVIGVGKKLDNT